VTRGSSFAGSQFCFVGKMYLRCHAKSRLRFLEWFWFSKIPRIVRHNWCCVFQRRREV
jgi:hypothetical protein